MVNGTSSNFLLLKKSFICADSLLVMYSSVTLIPPALSHTLPFATTTACVRAQPLKKKKKGVLSCARSVYVMRLCGSASRDLSWKEEMQF